jgi:hypothetical protein
LTFLAAYTYSHSIDDAVGEFGGVQNTYDLKAETASSDWDLRNNSVLSGSYELPVGPGRAFGSNLQGVASKLAEGWQLNTIYTAETGLPFDPTLTSPVANTGTFSRPDRICTGTLPNPSVTAWFNTSCFTTPPLYQYGDSGRNPLYGPGTNTFDFSVFKNTYISQDNSRYVQFRAEFFNLFDIPQFNNRERSVNRILPSGAGRTILYE